MTGGSSAQAEHRRRSAAFGVTQAVRGRAQVVTHAAECLPEPLGFQCHRLRAVLVGRSRILFLVPEHADIGTQDQLHRSEWPEALLLYGQFHSYPWRGGAALASVKKHGRVS